MNRAGQILVSIYLGMVQLHPVIQLLKQLAVSRDEQCDLIN